MLGSIVCRACFSSWNFGGGGCKTLRFPENHIGEKTFRHFVHFGVRCASVLYSTSIEFDQKTMKSIVFCFGTPLRFSMAEGHVRRGAHPRRCVFSGSLEDHLLHTKFTQEFEATKQRSLFFLFFESSKCQSPALSLVFCFFTFHQFSFNFVFFEEIFRSKSPSP